MKRGFAGLLVAVVAGAAPTAEPRPLGFSKADIGKVPAGWSVDRTGKGEGSIWRVAEDPSAPSRSGLVLAQAAESPATLFNLCVADGPVLRDVEVSVAFKGTAGTRDQGGGVVWRYQDANNHYVARANPLEDNLRVYKVVGGRRSPELRNADVKVTARDWHTLTVRMSGARIECSLDGRKYLDVTDDTFARAGKVGLWTKADARTSFDRLVVTDLAR